MVKFTIKGILPGLNDLINAERTNKYEGAALKKRAEISVLHAVQPISWARFDRPVWIVYHWFEPNRRRDKDNVSAFGRKVIQDALVMSHVLPNDGWKNIDGFEDHFAVDKADPRIEVEIYERGECDGN